MVPLDSWLSLPQVLASLSPVGRCICPLCPSPSGVLERCYCLLVLRASDPIPPGNNPGETTAAHNVSKLLARPHCRVLSGDSARAKADYELENDQVLTKGTLEGCVLQPPVVSRLRHPQHARAVPASLLCASVTASLHTLLLTKAGNS